MRTKKLITNATLLKLMFFCLVLALPTMAIAQDDLPCGGDDPYATECSIDDWLSALMIGGVGYGAYALSKSKKRTGKNTDEKEMSFKNIASQL